jgi:KaiC/GvpD/RAD55 family RecA-like ATPase
MGRTDHFVQFYERDTALLAAVDGYVQNGLTEGATAIVIATREHLDELEQQWARSLDLEAARDRGQYISFDAEETVSKLVSLTWSVLWLPAPARILRE